MTADWSAQQYLKFADQRTRAARDLLAQVALDEPQFVYDLGCGPGNSTELLAARFPQAQVTGVDSSSDMLAAARRALPNCRFEEGDLAQWTPPSQADLLFANAVFQWVPEHMAVLKRLAGTLSPEGVLAVQMPDNMDEPSHALMRETAADGPWAERLQDASLVRGRLAGPPAYYNMLRPHCRHIDIWHTIYNHPLEGHDAIVEWLKSTGLRPFLNALRPEERDDFLAAYRERLKGAYPIMSDGCTLLRFPRLFIVAVR
jgi:trans-aconitate 2-methyltransferase